MLPPVVVLWDCHGNIIKAMICITFCVFWIQMSNRKQKYFRDKRQRSTHCLRYKGNRRRNPYGCFAPLTGWPWACYSSLCVWMFFSHSWKGKSKGLLFLGEKAEYKWIKIKGMVEILILLLIQNNPTENEKSNVHIKTPWGRDQFLKIDRESYYQF